MKKTIACLFMFSFNSFADTYTDIGIDNAKVHGGQIWQDFFNASVEEDEDLDHSWRFTSNVEPSCINNTDQWQCKRGDIWLADEEQYRGRTIKYSFEFVLDKYPKWPSPYWMIVLQDLKRKNSYDIGKHPTSTIKLKNYNGGVYLAHFDNSWQWDHQFYNNEDSVHSIPDWDRGCWGAAPEPNDGIHHRENRCNGAFRINTHTKYQVEFIIAPDRASLIIDGNVITDVQYQTKSTHSLSDVKWGMYWDKDYNVTNDSNLRTVYRINNFKRLLKD